MTINVQEKRARRPSTYTICQNKLKMNKRLKYESWDHKSPRGEHRQENFRYPTQQHFHWYIPLGKRYKGKNKQMGLYQMSSFFNVFL